MFNPLPRVPSRADTFLSTLHFIFVSLNLLLLQRKHAPYFFTFFRSIRTHIFASFPTGAQTFNQAKQKQNERSILTCRFPFLYFH